MQPVLFSENEILLKFIVTQKYEFISKHFFQQKCIWTKGITIKVSRPVDVSNSTMEFQFFFIMGSHFWL